MKELKIKKNELEDLKLHIQAGLKITDEFRPAVPKFTSDRMQFCLERCLKIVKQVETPTESAPPA